MIYFTSANYFRKALKAIAPKRMDLPAGHVYSHARLRMLGNETLELTACLPNRYCFSLYCQEAQGVEGIVWLVGNGIYSDAERMPPARSLTLQQHTRGLNLRSDLHILPSGKEAQHGNRIVNLYADDYCHFETPDFPTLRLAVVEGEALKQACQRVTKFCQFSVDESRLLALVCSGGKLRFIGNAKESVVCYLEQTVNADIYQEGTWLFPGSFLAYVRELAEGQVQVYAREDDNHCLGFRSSRGELVLYCRQADDLQLLHHRLFERETSHAPIEVGRRMVKLSDLSDLITMQSPANKDPLLNIIMHPSKRGLFAYRQNGHDQYSVAPFTAFTEDELLEDLATDFQPKTMNSSALRAMVDCFKTYKCQVGEETISASLMRMRQTYVPILYSNDRHYITFFEPAEHPDPDTRIAISCGNLTDLIDLEEEEML